MLIEHAAASARIEGVKKATSRARALARKAKVFSSKHGS